MPASNRTRKTTAPAVNGRAPAAKAAAKSALAAPTIAPKAPGAEERVVAFYLPDPKAPDGLRAYTVPKNPSGVLVMKHLRDRRELGPVAASEVLFEDMLGREGVDALIAAEPDSDELAAVTKIITSALFGRSGNTRG